MSIYTLYQQVPIFRLNTMLQAPFLIHSTEALTAECFVTYHTLRRRSVVQPPFYRTSD